MASIEAKETVRLAAEQAALTGGKAKTSVAEKEKEITKVLTFALGGQAYGIEIPYVLEILGVPKITVVPCHEVPSYIKGIINVRSKVVPVINMRACFGKPEIEYDEKTCTIIVSHNDTSVGLIVDEVLDVLSVTPSVVARTPDITSVNNNKFIEYILEMKDGIKLILDIKKIIFD